MLVLRYGLRPPTKNGDLVHEQMRSAHRYRNTLVEIERGRRDAIRALHASVGDLPALAEAVKEADERAAAMVAKVKTYKAKHRTRNAPEDMRLWLDAARVAKRDAVQAWKAARQASRTEEVQTEIDRINSLAAELQRNARAYCKVYWGTYLLIEAAMDAARKAPYWGVFRGRVWQPLAPNNPSFVRWEGEGQVGVQIQGGLSSALACFADTRLQIERVPDRLGRPNSPWAILRMRVGSDGRAPIWAEWPMKMHRPISDGLIKGATVSLRKIGPREEWSVEITVDNEPIVRPSGDGAVAVNIGWRRVDGGIRVAYAVAEDGEVRELVVDDALLSSLQKADDLESLRDKRFNDARDALALWIKEHNVPDWLRARTATIHAWRSQARLASLALYWRKHRFDSDSAGYDALERWRYRDHHLWTWASDQRVKSRRRRRDMYRVWAARLAERYCVIVLHEHDMSKTARKPMPEDTEDNETARSNRQLVAPSELRLCLVNAKRTRDGATVQMPATQVTKTCHVCGSVETFDAAANIGHTCSECRTWWDQDDNAARNTMRFYRERSGDAKILGTARKLEKRNEDGTLKETKRQRIARLRREKEARLETARNVGCSQTESCAIECPRSNGIEAP